ncbi:hypothetical protein GCM10009681_49740 [Luedemannella helvata]|uniref:Serine aminopeptidase S33 domain-containing protein n=1 Tax=Luedemannella helvata TaxID=349315 RepID=A0ABN2L3G3_9ACTN
MVVLLTLAGCGTADEPDPAPVTSKAASFAELAPDPVERCDYPTGTRKVVVTTADGVKLAGAEVGSGPRGLVLLHQRGADLCGWGEHVPALTKAGLRVLAIDLRCNGMSDCDRDSPGDTFDQTKDYATDAAGAAAYLRANGAAKVAVMGASMGAVTAVVAGGRFPDQFDAVVGLSVFSTTWNASGGASTDVRTAADAVPKIAAPVLIGVGGLDTGGTITAADARKLLAGAPAAARSTVVDRPESGRHGWNMLQDGEESILAEVLVFLKTNLPG